MGFIEEITSTGYSIIDGFLPSHKPLLQESQRLDELGLFSLAGIGRTREHHPTVRGDRILWWDDRDLVPAQLEFLERVEMIKREVNRELFLGLNSYECHFAIYPPGTGYDRHLDVAIGTRSRVLSTVYYLNGEWTPDMGGELRLFLPEGPRDISPIANRLVVFLSEKIEHEVLASQQIRRSVTGWFHIRGI